MRRIEAGELPGGTGFGVIGAKSVLELFHCRAGGGVRFVHFALRIEGVRQCQMGAHGSSIRRLPVGCRSMPIDVDIRGLASAADPL